MPLLWKYLISDFLKITCLCTCTFVALLLTLRFDDIAHFACLGSSWLELVQFIALQLPYLLPIALPFSALISSYLLFSRLSQRQELTAMRASGISLRSLLSPILIAAAFLSLGDFYLTSEIASTAHLLNGQMRHKLRTINPLLMLQNKRILAMQGIYCETLGAMQHGEFASDVFFALPDRTHRRLSLFLAKTIRGSNQSVEAEGMTLLHSLPAKEGFDTLSLENVAYLDTPFETFTPALQQKTWTLQPDHLKLKLLQRHIEVQKESLSAPDSPEEAKEIKKRIYKSYSELMRRLSISLALFTFTFIGAAFSIQIGRQSQGWTGLCAGVLSGLTLFCYFLAKSFDDRWIISALLYILPQLLLIFLSCARLRQLSRGRE